MTFSAGDLTKDEIAYVRDKMNELERHPDVMRCFQNVDRATEKSEQQQRMFFQSGNEFTIYYRKQEVDAIEKVLFKLRLKFPGFVAHTTQTLQEHF